MSSRSIIFASSNSGNKCVAGIPAAARLARAAARDAETRTGTLLIIAAPGGFVPTDRCLHELSRLAPSMEVRFADASALHGAAIVGEKGRLDVLSHAPLLRDEAKAALDDWEGRVLAETGKTSDGIVSRTINRPISRAISRVLLRIPWIRPDHATALTALTGLAMIVALLLGSRTGAVAGALLFQCASIVDGVDGEIARAKFLANARGAMLDSLVDAVTNLGFLAGLSANLYMRGQPYAAITGAIGLTILACGLGLLGLQSRRAGRALSFDGVKDRFRDRENATARWLTYITMRDFYCAFFVVLMMLGLEGAALTLFACAAAIWLLVVCRTLR